MKHTLIPATVLVLASIAGAQESSVQTQLDALKGQVAALKAELAAASAFSGVGIIDVEKIARELGVAARMQEQAATQETAAKRQLQARYAQLRKDVEEAQAKLGPFPTAEQQKAFAEQRTQANEQLRQLESSLRGAIATNRNAAIEKFRNELHPCIAKVAGDRKVTAVLAQTGAVVWCEKTIDLTDAVLQEARRAGIK